MKTPPDELPLEHYRQLMEDSPLPTVDIIFFDQQRSKTLLGRRTNEPYAGQWYSFGGRLYKNEEFADAAVRIAKQEVGLSLTKADVKQAGVINEINPSSIFEGINYHAVNIYFACVIDDALMEISHVIRGEDHISNTPKQIMIYEALGFKIPKFAHLPLIMGTEGGRLSKRTGATAATEYRKMGYLPEAIVNYLMLLGWSPGENQEVVKFADAVRKFSIKKINKTAAEFSVDKLNWINAQYIKKTDTKILTDLLVPFLKEKGYIKDDFDRKGLESIVRLFQGRMTTLLDFLDWAEFVFVEKFSVDPEAKEKYLSHDRSREFALLSERLKALDRFDLTSTEKTFRDLVEELKISSSDLVHPVRVALTGKSVGPGLFETMTLLGKEKTIRRLQEAFKS